MKQPRNLFSEQFEDFINFSFLKLVIVVLFALDKIVPKLVFEFKYYIEF